MLGGAVFVGWMLPREQFRHEFTLHPARVHYGRPNKNNYMSVDKTRKNNEVKVNLNEIQTKS